MIPRDTVTKVYFLLSVVYNVASSPCAVTQTPNDVYCDCSNRNLTSIPFEWISNATIVNLSNNLITQVTENDTMFMPETVTELYLNHNNIHEIHNDSFSKLRNLKVRRF